MKGQLRFDEIERFKKSLSMQEIFHTYEKDTELVIELNFEISEVIAEKEKLYSEVKLVKNCLELFIKCLFPEKKCGVEQLSLSRFIEARRIDDLSKNI